VPNMNDNLVASARMYSTSTTCVLSQSRSPSHVHHPPVLITDRCCKDTVTGEYSGISDCPPSVFSGNLKVVDHPAFQTDRYSDAQKVALTHTLTLLIENTEYELEDRCR